VSQVIIIRDTRSLERGCYICGARAWDCTVDGCQPGARHLDGDVIHCKICNTLYIVEIERPAVRPSNH
jgi:hypothetical protein